MKMRLRIKNRSSRYNVNRPRHTHKYTKYKMCLSIMVVKYILSHTKATLKYNS